MWNLISEVEHQCSNCGFITKAPSDKCPLCEFNHEATFSITKVLYSDNEGNVVNSYFSLQAVYPEHQPLSKDISFQTYTSLAEAESELSSVIKKSVKEKTTIVVVNDMDGTIIYNGNDR